MSEGPEDFHSLLERLAPGAAGRETEPRAARPGPAKVAGSGELGGVLRLSTRRLSRGARLEDIVEARPEERLSWVSIQYASFFSLVALVASWTHTQRYVAESWPSPDPIPEITPLIQTVDAVVTVLLSLVVFFVARQRLVKGRAATALCVIYYVAMSTGISVFELCRPWPPSYVAPTITWVCIWIVVYPMVVPLRGWYFVLGAFLSAAAGPAVMWVWHSVSGLTIPSRELAIWLFAPPFLMAVLALYRGPNVHRMKQVMEHISQLGSYQLVRLIGCGGMGEVWLGEHDLLRRPAAIKLIRPEALMVQDTAERRKTLARFDREARATAALRSQHTIEIYDFGLSDEGAFFFVMELLDGLDLDALILGHGPQPVERVVHALLQVCDSLSEAHAADLVHRDIKPANIFLCRFGNEFDVVKVLDFGLVRAIESDETPGADLTAAGALAGTPAYMAPEQIESAAKADARSDLYALGCVAYRLLTGQRVFGELSAGSVLVAHQTEAPASLRSHRPELSVELDRVVLRCLEKRPEDRPQSAAQLADELRALGLASRWTRERARAWWTEHMP
jgi:serine/threonine-protein kinase